MYYNQVVDNIQKEEVLKYLKSKKIAVVATVNKNNTPHAATIYYYVDDHFNFFFATNSTTRKVENILNNPNVALVVGTENEPVTVQVEGVAKALTGEEFIEMTKILTPIVNSSNYIPIINSFKEGHVDIFKIVSKFVNYINIKNITHPDASNYFIEIKPES